MKIKRLVFLLFLLSFYIISIGQLNAADNLLDEIFNDLNRVEQNLPLETPVNPMDDIVPSLTQMTEANKYFASKDYTRAREIYQKVFCNDPKIQMEAKVAKFVCEIEIAMRLKEQELFQISNKFENLAILLKKLSDDKFFSADNIESDIFLRSRLFIKSYLQIMTLFCYIQHYDSWHKMGVLTKNKPVKRIKYFIDWAMRPIQENASVQQGACYNFMASKKIEEKDFSSASQLLVEKTDPQKQSAIIWRSFLNSIIQVKMDIPAVESKCNAVYKSFNPVAKFIPTTMERLKEIQEFVVEIKEVLYK